MTLKQQVKTINIDYFTESVNQDVEVAHVFGGELLVRAAVSCEGSTKGTVCS